MYSQYFYFRGGFMNMYNKFDTGFGIFFTLFIIVFLLILGLIIYSIVKSISQNAKDKASPVLSVDAKVVTKRMDVSGSSHMDQNTHISSTSSHSYYYATFEVESGDRIEFSVSGEDYGMLAEGDIGKLTFQGSRFLSFKRNIY